jgi:hypothetical protein
MQLIAFLLAGNFALATPPPEDYTDSHRVQPYIESLKEKYDIKPAQHEEAAPTRPPVKSSETLPEDHFSTNPKEVQPYIESIKIREGLEPDPLRAPPSNNPNEVQPYLESVKAGRELEPKFRKTVNQAAGFSIGASSHFNVSSDKVAANSFNTVYNTDTRYAPAADVFYEREVFRNHYIGAFSLTGRFNFILLKGHGIFTREGITSQDTNFRFYALPVSIGAGYRFLQARFFQPFVQGAMTGIPMIETRDDQHPSRRAISRAASAVVGGAISLDWISRKDAWAQYDMNDILHTYLVLQGEIMRTLSGPVAFNYDGFYAGLMFEF